MNAEAKTLANPFRSNKSLNHFKNRSFTFLVWLVGIITILFICGLLFLILEKGMPKLSFAFLYGLPSEIDEGGGIGPALFNSFYVLFISLAISIPLGMAAGIYLSEFAPNNKFITFIRICVEGLASVPSIIFGLFGIAIFVEAMGVGLTILGGAVSLAFLNLPVLTRVTEEAIRAVPAEMKSASFALGGTHLQTIQPCSNSGCSERDYYWNLSRRRPCIRGERCNHPYCGSINLWRDVGFQLVLARGNTCCSSMVRSIGSNRTGCAGDRREGSSGSRICCSAYQSRIPYSALD